MKASIILLSIAAGFAFAGCDVQSGISKKSVEEFTTTPTPGPSRTPEPAIDPADVVTVDTAVEGPKINVNPTPAVKEVNCSKYNRVHVNADGLTLNVKGVCRQIMLNGDRNKITGVAFTEIVANGTDNEVRYTKFVNGKRPIIANNASGNTIERVAAPEDPVQKPNR
ncbi:MAG: DUF3060 domain-containing protein [Pyrinomonadaceae bacterium]